MVITKGCTKTPAIVSKIVIYFHFFFHIYFTHYSHTHYKVNISFHNLTSFLNCKMALLLKFLPFFKRILAFKITIIFFWQIFKQVHLNFCFQKQTFRHRTNMISIFYFIYYIFCSHPISFIIHPDVNFIFILFTCILFFTDICHTSYSETENKIYIKHKEAREKM